MLTAMVAVMSSTTFMMRVVFCGLAAIGGEYTAFTFMWSTAAAVAAAVGVSNGGCCIRRFCGLS